MSLLNRFHELRYYHGDPPNYNRQTTCFHSVADEGGYAISLIRLTASRSLSSDVVSEMRI